MKIIVIFFLTFTLYVSAEPPVLTDHLNTVDELGNVHFGYNDGQTSRHEIRTKDGIVRGAYQFVDANGEIQKVAYTADPVNGYQLVDSPINDPIVETSSTEAISTSSLPIPVQDTPEVIEAREAHLQALRLASSRV